MSRVRAPFLLAAALGSLASLRTPAAADPAERPSLDGASLWACFYGRNMSYQSWASLRLVVTDPDGFTVPQASGTAAGAEGPLRLAYVSVGEANEARPWWPEVAGDPLVVEGNPGWPGAHRVDIRAPKWRSLILERVVPEALSKGYGGVMLDTIDTAGYLESSAPARFAGSVDAAVSLVLELRERHPGIAIVVNNGLPLLDRIGDAVDGVMVEDLYTRCPPGSERCGATPRRVSRSKEAMLDRFRQRTGKPVFALIYARPSEHGLRRVRRAAARARRRGYRPYVASPTLRRLGVIDP